MTDRMYPLDILSIYRMIIKEERQSKRIFGIPEQAFYRPVPEAPFALYLGNRFLEAPLGVAAGPHTQLTQNILSAWLCGARFIELKTVQTKDDLTVTKPCIDMADLGYNCEWSQELSLDESFAEYLKAFILIALLREHFGFTDEPDCSGTIFNMSIGYSLLGIKQPNIQRFLDRVENAAGEIDEVFGKLRGVLPKGLSSEMIPPKLSDNVTLSTMHGCPPEEILTIVKYLVNVRALDTTVKLNPVILGSELVDHILRDRCGFSDVSVPESAYTDNLGFDDAVDLIRELIDIAKKAGRRFNVKLTNTLEVHNRRSVLPATEKLTYLSGRALHPLAIALAAKLRNVFGSELPVSLSAGVDLHNVAEVLSCGIVPVTVCTDLLKPGGYQRLSQYFERIGQVMNDRHCRTMEDFLGGKSTDSLADRDDRLDRYFESILDDRYYHRDSHPWPPIKGKRSLGEFDCIEPPCQETCPTWQRVPEYIGAARKGNIENALKIILADNPFPNATGMVCDRPCMSRCTRIDIDEPVDIRGIKNFIAAHAKETPSFTPRQPGGIKVAIIGGGPSGLSTAYYLGDAGFEVTVFEAKAGLGGMIANVLPDFRADRSRIERDIERIVARGITIGITIESNHRLDSPEELKTLLDHFTYIYVATGLPRAKPLGLPNDTVPGIVDFLVFLEQVKDGQLKKLPKKVGVIGGGNSAIDVARTVRRLLPDDGTLHLLYRRAIDDMPADREELEDLLAEGITIEECTAPVRIIVEKGKLAALECMKMSMGEEVDSTGRRRPQPIVGSEFVLPLDLLIPATGQDGELGFLDRNLDRTIITKGKIAVDETNRSFDNDRIFAGGDLVRGASSIVAALADGKVAARRMMAMAGVVGGTGQKEGCSDTRNSLLFRKGRRTWSFRERQQQVVRFLTFTPHRSVLSDEQLRSESERCLRCDLACDICVTVCPNRANIPYECTPRSYTLSDIKIDEKGIVRGPEYTFAIEQNYQILNLGDFCNECGNCTTFCPTSGKPYLDKPKVYLSAEAFEREQDDCNFFETTNSHWRLKAKSEGKIATIERSKKDGLTIYRDENFLCRVGRIDGKLFSCQATGSTGTTSHRRIVMILVLFEAAIATFGTWTSPTQCSTRC